MPKKLYGALALFCGLTAFAAGSADPTEAEWAKMREEALNKPRRIIINDDGCDMTEYPKDLPLTRENIFKQMLDKVKGTEVDTVTFCPFAVGHVLATRSLVTDMHLSPSAQKTTRNLTPELLALGTDTLQLAVEFCRANNLEIFASMRVNDIHDSWNPQWRNNIKNTHPEQLFGTVDNAPPYGSWNAFDFALPAVRERFRAIIEELLSHYDVDGVELDFYRFPTFFKSVAQGGSASEEEIAAFTQLMRDIRSDADRIGKRRGRYLIITARLPDSAALARDTGLDIETWMKEKLIDIFIPGGDQGYFASVSDAVKLGKKYGVKVYPSVDTSWLGGGRSSNAAFHAQSAAAMAVGADGIYYFNMFYAPTYIPEMRRELKDLRFVPKLYYGYYQRLSQFSANMNKFDQLADLRGDGLVVYPGEKPASMLITVGDDFSDPEVVAMRPRVVLDVNTLNADDEVPLQASINGKDVGKPVFVNGNYTFQVDPSLVKAGENRIEFSLDPKFDLTLPPQTILAGNKILRGANQPPWRRLFPAHDFPNAEKIIDGSYWISDTGTGIGECANLLYPLPDYSGRQFGCEVEVLVEKSTAPEAVALRIATGEFVELITFSPDRVGLKFAGESAEFNTTDGFHKYAVDINNGRITVFADGKKLVSGKLVMKADDPTGRMTGNNLAIPNMHSRSLVIGSLSEKGTGAARWKNLRIGGASGIRIADVSLGVTFAGKEDPEIVAAIADPPAFKYDLDASRGAEGFKPVKIDYKRDFHSFSDGVLRLNNDDPKMSYATCSLNDNALLLAGKGVLVVEWVVEAGVPAKADENSFQMVIRPATGKEGMIYPGIFKFAAGRVITPWRTIVTPKTGFLTCRFLINLANGNAVFQLNGETVAEGNLAEFKDKPAFFFGDGSIWISGSAAIKSLKVGLREAR